MRNDSLIRVFMRVVEPTAPPPQKKKTEPTFNHNIRLQTTPDILTDTCSSWENKMTAKTTAGIAAGEEAPYCWRNVGLGWDSLPHPSLPPCPGEKKPYLERLSPLLISIPLSVAADSNQRVEPLGANCETESVSELLFCGRLD